MQPIAPVGGGLNESVAPSEQPAGTYSDGENVRGIDPKTGRVVWAAQRAGLQRVGDAFPPGTYAKHFTTASKLLNARKWVNLTAVPQDETVPAVVQSAWAVDLGDSVLDVAESALDGNALFLIEGGEVVVVNKMGVEVKRLGTRTPFGFRTVPRLEMDELGSIYIAGSREDAFQGGAGRILRWARQTDGTYTEAWTAIIPGKINTFAYGVGAVYYVEEPLDPLNAATLPQIGQIGSALLGPQISWTQSLIAYPVGHLTVNDRGQVLASSPYSTQRRPDGAFTTRSVGFTPSELTDWRNRGWAWLDSHYINEGINVPANGDDVVAILDKRFVETFSAPINPLTTERSLRSANSDLFANPTWDSSAFGGQGAVSFTGNASLVSQFVEALPVDSDPDAPDGVNQAGIIPSDFDTWTMSMIVETRASNFGGPDRQVLGQRTDNDEDLPDWGVYSNERRAFLRDAAPDPDEFTNDSSTTGAPNISIWTFYHDGTNITHWINGNEQAAVAFSNNKQAGSYELGDTDVEVPGARSVMGAGRPLETNLLKSSDAFVYINGNQANKDLLTDGITGPTRGSGQRFTLFDSSYLRLDFGEDTEMDSLFWTNPSRRDCATEFFLYLSTDSTGPVTDGNASPPQYNYAFTVPVLRRESGAPETRQEYKLDVPAGSKFRYVTILAQEHHDRNQWAIGEFAVRKQNLLALQDQSAEFNFGELVAFKGGTAEERQDVEGYLAHRWGVSHLLAEGHDHKDPGNGPTGLGSLNDPALNAAALSTELPCLAKYGADGALLTVYSGAGAGLSAIAKDGRVFSYGDPEPPGDSAEIQNYGSLIVEFDEGRRTFSQTGTRASSERPSSRVVDIAIGPRESLFIPWVPIDPADPATLRRYLGTEDGGAKLWELNTKPFVRGLVVAGLQRDGYEQGQDSGPEFLYAATEGTEGARRVDVMGLQKTGVTAQRDIERLAVLSNGSVYRNNGDGWTSVEEGALPGPLPFSATLFGETVFADGLGYRLYNHTTQRLLNFEDLVEGDFPPRCQLIAAYRSRLLLARGDNAFTIYQSAFGDIRDFNFGTEVNSIAQAAAGTVASQGRVPEPITALMPFNDDFLFIGTTESLFVLNGDLSAGGQLDQVDKSQGVAFGYAWCESPSALYYFSSRGGVFAVVPGQRPVSVSGGRIQRRLEDIDLLNNRVRLAYNAIDKTIHVFVISNALNKTVQHFAYEEPLRAWHIDTFDDTVTAVSALQGDEPDDRTVLLGFFDGYAREWAQYADDDDGVQIKSRVVSGPLLPGSAATELRISGIEADLASDQGAVEVAVRASNSADRPGPPSDFQELPPGRGLGVGVNHAAPAVFIETRGTGLPWTVYGMRAELKNEGRARSTS